MRYVPAAAALLLRNPPPSPSIPGPSQASQALTRVSGQLQAAAALLVELARAASASSVELAGSNPLMTANTAAVLQQQEGSGAAAGRLAPAFPTLYPQLPPGMGGDRNAGTLFALTSLLAGGLLKLP